MPNIVKLVLSSLLQGEGVGLFNHSMDMYIKTFTLTCIGIKYFCLYFITGSSLVAAMDFFNKLVVLQIVEYSRVVNLLTGAVYNPASSSGPQPSPSSSNFVVHRQV